MELQANLNKRVVVCLNAGNYLQNFVYDQDEGEWVAGQLAILKAESHPESKLTASYGGGKRYVFFQNPSAEIQEILANEDGIWKPSRTFSTSKPALGASLAAVILKDGVHVFYSHTDKSIHQVSLQGGKSTGKSRLRNDFWIREVHRVNIVLDSLVPYTDDGSSKSNIVVAPKDSSFGLEYLNAKNECYVLADGKSTKTGEITADGFQPVKGEQCYRPCGGGGNRGPIIIYGGTVIFY